MSERVEFPSRVKPPAPSGAWSEWFGTEVLEAVEGAVESVGLTIAHWSAADHQLRVMMLSIAGDDLKSAANLIDQLRADGALDALLPFYAAAKGRSDLGTAITKFRESRSSLKAIRDRFAHGVWSSRSDLPGFAILTGANASRKAHQRLFEPGFGQLDGPRFEPQGQEMWSPDDFRKAASASAALSFAAQGLTVCFAREPEEASWLREALEAQGLLSAPPHILAQNQAR